MIKTSRRSLITGLISLVAAPAIVRVSSLMPVSAAALKPEFEIYWGNTSPTLAMITREAVELFVNSNAFLQNINDQWPEHFAVGSQLRIRLP